MPFDTAKNIIARYKKTGAREPCRTYSSTVYNYQQILEFLFKFYAKSAHASATLQELQELIWEHRAHLLPLDSDSPPSLSTIHRILIFGKLVWKKVISKTSTFL